MVNKYVISGGPGVGKTSVIEELGKNFVVFHEIAREVLEGKLVDYIKSFEAQYEIFRGQVEQHKKTESETRDIFFDRGIPDSLAYLKHHGFKPPDDLLEASKRENTNYRAVFLLDFIPYKKDHIRREDENISKEIHSKINSVYRDLGYMVIDVPFMRVEERVEYIESFLDD